MFVILGEFLLCCLIVLGTISIGQSRPKLAEGAFVLYATIMLISYFITRWKYERLRKKVMKFKKMRKKVSNFDFGLPPPLGMSNSSTSSNSQSTTTPPKKSK